jgi:hypothetical protein
VRKGKKGYLVYVGLLFSEMKFAKTFVLDFLKQVILKQFFDKRVFEWLIGSIQSGQFADVGSTEQIGRKTCGERGCRVRGSSGGGSIRCRWWVPDFEPLELARLGLR